MTDEQNLQAQEQTSQESQVTSGDNQGYNPDDIQKLIKRFEDSQAFIEQLKSENAELRSKQEVNSSVEDVLKKYKQENPQQETPNQNDLATFWEQQWEKKTIEQKRQANYEQIQSKLKERFAEKSDEILDSRLAEIGMSKDEWQDLARRNPAVAERAISLNEKSQNTNAQIHAKTWSNPATKDNAELAEAVQRVTRMGATHADMQRLWDML